jgi:predicted kinase
MEVIIMRGIPGSGKSTWIKNFIAERKWPENDYVIVSADHYFMVGSCYRYDPKKIGEAHASCLRDFVAELYPMRKDAPRGVIVDNTNTTAVEIAPYYALALAYGAEVKIVRVHCPFEVAHPRNVHGVPQSTVWRMYQNILSERLPPHWNEEIVLHG